MESSSPTGQRKRQAAPRQCRRSRLVRQAIGSVPQPRLRAMDNHQFSIRPHGLPCAIKFASSAPGFWPFLVCGPWACGCVYLTIIASVEGKWTGNEGGAEARGRGTVQSDLEGRAMMAMGRSRAQGWPGWVRQRLARLARLAAVKLTVSRCQWHDVSTTSGAP